MDTLSPPRAARRLSAVDRAIIVSVAAMAAFNLLVAASHLLPGAW